MTNPAEEYLQCKEAQGSGFLSRIGGGFKEMLSARNVGMTAGAAVLAGGLDFPGEVARKAYYAITKKRDFSKMMDTNPDLRSLQKENPRQFNAHYTSLRGVNPQFASDPVVSGTYMRQMSLSPETAGKVVVESLGGLPRPTQGTKARDVFGLAPGPLEDVQRMRMMAGIEKTRGDIAAQPGVERLRAAQMEKAYGDIAGQPSQRVLTMEKMKAEMRKNRHAAIAGVPSPRG